MASEGLTCESQAWNLMAWEALRWLLKTVTAERGLRRWGFEKRWWFSRRAQLGVARSCEMYGWCMGVEEGEVLEGITMEGFCFMYLKA